MPADRRRTGLLWILCIGAVLLVMLSSFLTRWLVRRTDARFEKIASMVTEIWRRWKRRPDRCFRAKRRRRLASNAPQRWRPFQTVGSLSATGRMRQGSGQQDFLLRFYWSPEGMVDFADYTLADIPDTAVGIKTEAEGDNWFYSEKITGDWYYFEWHF